MTRKSRKIQRRVIASILTGMFIVQQTMTLTVVASEISGVSGANGVFNINPETKAGALGFRHYEKFNLTKGDIANLNYADIQTFVNMVDNQININGVLNTMKNGAFYNGKAIFVSPNGMVVGASGVLNVGSLGVYTPDQVNYQNLVKSPSEATLNAAKNANIGGAIKIDGKVFSANEIELKGGDIAVGKNAGVFAGVNETQISNNLNNADALFNQLVNTENLNTGSAFTSSNGEILITSNRNSASNTAGVTIDGHVMNYGTGNIEIRNNAGSDKGVNISGTVGNLNGTLLVNNNQGDTVISGNLINNGETRINHTPARSGDTSTGLTFDANSGLTISGNVDTEGSLTIMNNGNEGINISGDINHSGGDISIQNGYGYNGTPAQPELNNQIAALNITGNVTNTDGNTNITNFAAGGLNVGSGGSVNNEGALTMLNTGSGGLTINGDVANMGTATVTNEAGALNIGGSFTNIGDSTILNNGTGLNVSGSVENQSGTLNMTNNGANGFNVTGSIESQGATLTNNEGAFNLGGSFTNSGDATVLNDGTELNVSADVTNTNGTLNMTNNGSGGFDITGDSVFNTQGLNVTNNQAAFNIDGNITNTGTGNYKNYGSGLNIGGSITNNGTGTYYNEGADGLNISGSVANTGEAEVTNTAGVLDINGSFSNSGNTQISNTGSELNISGSVTNTNGTLAMNNTGANGFNVTQTGSINAQGLNMTNSGNAGMNLNGSITNTGTANVTNEAGALNLGGTFTNSGNATILNNGTALNVTGDVTNQNGQLTMTNNGNGGFTVADTSTINAQGIDMTNNAGAFNMNGQVTNIGTGNYENNGSGFNINGSINNQGDSTFYNKGSEGLNINGTVTNEGTATVTNDAGNLNIAGAFSNAGNTTMVNDGNQLNVSGSVTNTDGQLTMTNNGAGGFVIDESGVIDAEGLLLTNNGDAGFDINGTVTNTGSAEVLNTKGDLNVDGTINNTGNATLTNQGANFNVNGTITNQDGTLAMVNENGALNIIGNVSNTNNTTITNHGADGLNVSGTITNGGTLDMDNSGAAGVNVTSNITSDGDMTINNTGANGVNFDSTARVTGKEDVYIKNESEGGVNVKGLVKADNNVNIQSTNGDVVIGDNTDNDNYITAGNNIDIVVVDGNILNYGVEKTLLNAAGNLNMNVTDGSIGTEHTDNTIGPNSRDFTKSINAKVKGKVTALASKANRPDDLVINYAAIDSDMNINQIKADGNVILTVDYGSDGTTRYNMVNASDDPTKANVEGKSISMIASGNIGSAENKLTFNQTDASNGHYMDVLANEDINMKGLDDKYTNTEVRDLISKEGNIYFESSGDLHVQETTADKDITIIGRGANVTIDYLGTVPNMPVDYYGPNDNITPDNANIKALDINKNVRPDGEMVDGYYAWADSTVRVTNAKLDGGNLDITADNIYANGVAAHFNKDGFSKVADDSTNKVEGAGDIPTGHAVRPDDVTEIGRDEHERNYYYPEGDGDGIFNGEQSDVDPDDGVASDTPLEIPDEPSDTDTDTDIDVDVDTDTDIDVDTDTDVDVDTDTDIDVDTDTDVDVDTDTDIDVDTDTDVDPDPGPQPQPEPEPDEELNLPNEDGRSTYIQRKIGDDDIDSIDKRQYMRFNIADSNKPVLLERSNNGIDGLIDISRGGIAVKHDNNLSVGDVIPVHLTYGDLDINADVKVVSASTNRAGAMFVNLDQATANKLLYLNILLEDANNISFNP